MTNYRKVTERDVYDVVKNKVYMMLVIEGNDYKEKNVPLPIHFSVQEIAEELKTSAYQARKYLKSLQEKEAVEIIQISKNCTCTYMCHGCGDGEIRYKVWNFKNELEEYESKQRKDVI